MLTPSRWKVGLYVADYESPGEVGSGVVTDPANRTQIEIDVGVFAAAVPGERRRVLSLGEVKWGRTMGMRDLSRLERGRDLLAQNGFDTATAKLACYSGSGFDDHLREAAANRADVLLVDPEQLYA
jgi:hypothetical protein